MKVRELELKGLKLIELDSYPDPRGFFIERFIVSKFKDLGLFTDFIQDNHSMSLPNVIRGLHYQYDPPQNKLVGVIRGKMWDVSVDLRPKSPTFGKYFTIELSDKNNFSLWIPFGFAHGFCTLGEEPTDVMYKVDTPYNPKTSSGIHWNDPELKIPWPVKNPIVSKADAELPTLAQCKEKLIHHFSI
ncbi:MAG: dTDP-4-dehydrorhamnose 3,5-epimerase [Deltaproteobacteria bacterium]|nr:dTDP-4-dehydrorhamnose 3,5-epimerase [Deltaproteobacteria bacterium]